MTKPVAEATIVGDFSEGTTFADHDRAYTFGRKDGKPFVTVTFGQAPPETFTVDYTLGAKRYQGYLSMLPEGRMFVLPIFWHVEHKRWMDWKEITPIPDGAHDIRQIWNVNCFNCHATNIVQGYDVAAKRYNSSWTEMGIGCEACHGPGREHNTLMEAWEKNPALKPAYDTSDKNRQLSDTLKILSTRSSDPRRRVRHLRVLPRQQEQRVRRVQGRRPLYRFRHAVPDQRADSRQRSPGRVLARRPPQSLQPAAGADDERVLPGGRDFVRQLPSVARVERSRRR